MKITQNIIVSLGVAMLTLGCQFHARSADDYSTETSRLLETKQAELKSCYDEILEKDAKAKGVVAVTFTVEAKTGLLKDAKLDETKTTAPKTLSECVLGAIEGLKLDPPDQREGQASWSYEFKPNKRS